MDGKGKVFKQTYLALRSKRARLIANKGGTRSGKTYSIMSMFVFLAMLPGGCTKDVDVVSESFPHLKRGAMNDILEILDHEGLIEGVAYDFNRTDNIFTFRSGWKIRFFPADDWGKVKGARRDILYINEANRIEWEVYRQLSVRTTESIIIDWNPDAQFWYELKGLDNREDTVEIHSTYKDNRHLSAIQVAEIESNRNDENWWNVYGLGLTGHAEGIVYKNWDVVQDIPAYARLVGHGLDFGYMNDPTAIVSVWYADGELYLDERLYMPGLTNNKIAERCRTLEDGPIVADSAEMKSIDEIKDHGVRRIEAAIKGKDSIAMGIDILRRYKLHLTQDSLNLIAEARNYKYKENKITGEMTNEPVDRWNHLLDAARYVALNKLKKSAVHGRPVAKVGEV